MLVLNPLSSSAALPRHPSAVDLDQDQAAFLGTHGCDARGAGCKGGLDSPSAYPNRNHCYVSTCLQQLVPGFIPPISNIGKPGLQAAGLVLGDGLILALESWTVAACAEHMGWDAAASEIQETLERGLEMPAADLVDWQAGSSSP